MDKHALNRRHLLKLGGVGLVSIAASSNTASASDPTATEAQLSVELSGPDTATIESDISFELSASSPEPNIDSVLADWQSFENVEVETVDTDTFIEEVDLIVLDELQAGLSVEFTATVPENAVVGDQLEVTGDLALEDAPDETFAHTVEVIEDPADDYRDDNGDVDERGVVGAIGDWRNGDLNPQELIKVIGEWRKGA